MDHFIQRKDDGGDLFLNQRGKSRICDAQIGGKCRFLLNVADPSIQNQRQCAPFRLGFGGHIPDQFFVCGQSLAPGTLEPPLRRKIGIHHHEIFRHHIIPDGLQQKTLSAAVSAHNKPKGSPAVADDVHIPEQGINLGCSAHGDVGKAHPGHNAAFQGIDQRLRDSSWYFHGKTISFKSLM